VVEKELAVACHGVLHPGSIVIGKADDDFAVKKV
jgi:hypothetical protein